MKYLLTALFLTIFSINFNANAGVLEDSVFKAVEAKDLNALEKSLQLGADINFQDANGDTALIKATKANNKEIAKYLVENGADAQIANNAGYTALDIAKANKFTQITKIIKSAETGISTGSPAAYGGAAASGSSSAATASAAAAAGATGAGVSTGLLVAGGLVLAGGGVALAAGGGGGAYSPTHLFS